MCIVYYYRSDSTELTVGYTGNLVETNHLQLRLVSTFRFPAFPLCARLPHPTALQSTSDRLGILIDILQITPSFSNAIEGRLLRDDFPVRVLSDVGKFSPSGEVFGVSLVALNDASGFIRHLCDR